MEWLFNKLTRNSISPMRAKKTADSDDDESSKSADRAAHPSTSSSSRMTPWILGFVLNELDSQKSFMNHRLVEIISRGGPFWNPERHALKSSGELEGWLLVSDGQFSIHVWLTEDCRKEIWNRVSGSVVNSMYTFLDYSRGYCGSLEKYSLKITSRNCELICHSFQTKPQLQHMIMPNNGNLVQPITENVEFRHALQSYDDDLEATTNSSTATSSQRQGDARAALKNDDLMNRILLQARNKFNIPKMTQGDIYDGDEVDIHEEEVAVAAAAASSSMEAPVDVQDSDDDEEDNDSDSDEEVSWNLGDMFEKEANETTSDQSDHNGNVSESVLVFETQLKGSDHESDQEHAQPPGQPSKQRQKEQEFCDGGIADEVLRVLELPSSPSLSPSEQTSPPRSNKKRKRKHDEQTVWTHVSEQLWDTSISVISFDAEQPRESLKGKGSLSRWLNQNSIEAIIDES
jgi:hypothetical protein